MELWKPIPGFKYDASSEGRIRSQATGRIISTHQKKKHRNRAAFYERANLYAAEKGIQTPIFVHKAVLMAFVGPRPLGRQCRHLDGNSLNNRLCNLVWGTGEENRTDQYTHRPDHFLTREDIALILASPEKTATDVARTIGCHRQTVSNVRTGKHFNVNA